MYDNDFNVHNFYAIAAYAAPEALFLLVCRGFCP